MQLTTEQIEQYENQGIIFFPKYFSQPEVELMRAELSQIGEDRPGRVLEKDNQTVRALHGCHTNSSVFQCLIRHPRLLEPAQQILLSQVYLYQFKINFKAAFSGDVWPWHQDFVFWHKEDGMRSPRVINVMVFLDEVNEFNGPLYLIPASHKEGLIEVEARVPGAKDQQGGWKTNFSADLKYSLDRESITKLVAQRGLVAPKGPSGSVLFFHSNLAHGSGPNISPYTRKVALITYNSVHNIPLSKGEPRPEFLVSRDCTPLQSVADDILLEREMSKLFLLSV